MTREIAIHLGKLGVKVIILPVSSNPRDRLFPRTPTPEGEEGYEFDEILAQDNIEVRRVPQHAFHYRFDPFSVRKAVERVIDEQSVDIVFSYFYDGAFLGSLLTKHNIKFAYISTWQSYVMARDRAFSYSGLRGFFERTTYKQFIEKPHKRAEMLFATSQYTANELSGCIGVEKDRIHIAYLGVDEHFHKIPRKKAAQVVNLVYFGRVIISKGIWDAIEALGKLAAKGIKNWNFRLIGDAGKPAVAHANRLARQYGIEDKIQYAPAVDDLGLEKELQAAHLAIMPSHSESFGLAFAEAQAAGLPVVAYAVGSLPEVIENGVTGWLAPFRDVDKLADCIESALEDSERTYQFGMAGRERVARLFTWEKTGEVIFSRIQELLNETNH